MGREGGARRGISNLYIARMERPNKLATVQELLTTPDYDWERVGFWVDEGPAVLKKDGKLFLTFSSSATGACYCMGMLSASEDADLLDPASWKKERYPVVKTDAKKGIYGRDIIALPRMKRAGTFAYSMQEPMRRSWEIPCTILTATPC